MIKQSISLFRPLAHKRKQDTIFVIAFSLYISTSSHIWPYFLAYFMMVLCHTFRLPTPSLWPVPDTTGGHDQESERHHGAPRPHPERGRASDVKQPLQGARRKTA